MKIKLFFLLLFSLPSYGQDNILNDIFKYINENNQLPLEEEKLVQDLHEYLSTYKDIISKQGISVQVPYGFPVDKVISEVATTKHTSQKKDVLIATTSLDKAQLLYQELTKQHPERNDIYLVDSNEKGNGFITPQKARRFVENKNNSHILIFTHHEISAFLKPIANKKNLPRTERIGLIILDQMNALSSDDYFAKLLYKHLRNFKGRPTSFLIFNQGRSDSLENPLTKILLPLASNDWSFIARNPYAVKKSLPEVFTENNPHFIESLKFRYFLITDEQKDKQKDLPEYIKKTLSSGEKKNLYHAFTAKFFSLIDYIKTQYQNTPEGGIFISVPDNNCAELVKSRLNKLHYRSAAIINSSALTSSQDLQNIVSRFEKIKFLIFTPENLLIKPLKGFTQYFSLLSHPNPADELRILNLLVAKNLNKKNKNATYYTFYFKNPLKSYVPYQSTPTPLIFPSHTNNFYEKGLFKPSHTTQDFFLSSTSYTLSNSFPLTLQDNDSILSYENIPEGFLKQEELKEMFIKEYYLSKIENTLQYFTFEIIQAYQKDFYSYILKNNYSSKSFYKLHRKDQIQNVDLCLYRDKEGKIKVAFRESEKKHFLAHISHLYLSQQKKNNPYLSLFLWLKNNKPKFENTISFSEKASPFSLIKNNQIMNPEQQRFVLSSIMKSLLKKDFSTLTPEDLNLNAFKKQESIKYQIVLDLKNNSFDLILKNKNDFLNFLKRVSKSPKLKYLYDKYLFSEIYSSLKEIPNNYTFLENEEIIKSLKNKIKSAYLDNKEHISFGPNQLNFKEEVIILVRGGNIKIYLSNHAHLVIKNKLSEKQGINIYENQIKKQSFYTFLKEKYASTATKDIKSYEANSLPAKHKEYIEGYFNYVAKLASEYFKDPSNVTIQQKLASIYYEKPPVDATNYTAMPSLGKNSFLTTHHEVYKIFLKTLTLVFLHEKNFLIHEKKVYGRFSPRDLLLFYKNNTFTFFISKSLYNKIFRVGPKKSHQGYLKHLDVFAFLNKYGSYLNPQEKNLVKKYSPYKNTNIHLKNRPLSLVNTLPVDTNDLIKGKELLEIFRDKFTSNPSEEHLIALLFLQTLKNNLHKIYINPTRHRREPDVPEHNSFHLIWSTEQYDGPLYSHYGLGAPEDFLKETTLESMITYLKKIPLQIHFAIEEIVKKNHLNILNPHEYWASHFIRDFEPNTISYQKFFQVLEKYGIIKNDFYISLFKKTSARTKPPIPELENPITFTDLEKLNYIELTSFENSSSFSNFIVDLIKDNHKTTATEKDIQKLALIIQEGLWIYLTKRKALGEPLHYQHANKNFSFPIKEHSTNQPLDWYVIHPILFKNNTFYLRKELFTTPKSKPVNFSSPDFLSTFLLYNFNHFHQIAKEDQKINQEDFLETLDKVLEIKKFAKKFEIPLPNLNPKSNFSNLKLLKRNPRKESTVLNLKPTIIEQKNKKYSFYINFQNNLINRATTPLFLVLGDNESDMSFERKLELTLLDLINNSGLTNVRKLKRDLEKFCFEFGQILKNKIEKQEQITTSPYQGETESFSITREPNYQDELFIWHHHTSKEIYLHTDIFFPHSGSTDAMITNYLHNFIVENIEGFLAPENKNKWSIEVIIRLLRENSTPNLITRKNIPPLSDKYTTHHSGVGYDDVVEAGKRLFNYFFPQREQDKSSSEGTSPSDSSNELREKKVKDYGELLHLVKSEIERGVNLETLFDIISKNQLKDLREKEKILHRAAKEDLASHLEYGLFLQEKEILLKSLRSKTYLPDLKPHLPKHSRSWVGKGFENISFDLLKLKPQTSEVKKFFYALILCDFIDVLVDEEVTLLHFMMSLQSYGPELVRYLTFAVGAHIGGSFVSKLRLQMEKKFLSASRVFYDTYINSRHPYIQKIMSHQEVFFKRWLIGQVSFLSGTMLNAMLYGTYNSHGEKEGFINHVTKSILSFIAPSYLLRYGGNLTRSTLKLSANLYPDHYIFGKMGNLSDFLGKKFFNVFTLALEFWFSQKILCAWEDGVQTLEDRGDFISLLQESLNVMNLHEEALKEKVKDWKNQCAEEKDSPGCHYLSALSQDVMKKVRHYDALYIYKSAEPQVREFFRSVALLDMGYHGYWKNPHNLFNQPSYSDHAVPFFTPEGSFTYLGKDKLRNRLLTYRQEEAVEALTLQERGEKYLDGGERHWNKALQGLREFREMRPFYRQYYEKMTHNYAKDQREVAQRYLDDLGPKLSKKLKNFAHFFRAFHSEAAMRGYHKDEATNAAHYLKLAQKAKNFFAQELKNAPHIATLLDHESDKDSFVVRTWKNWGALAEELTSLDRVTVGKYDLREFILLLGEVLQRFATQYIALQENPKLLNNEEFSEKSYYLENSMQNFANYLSYYSQTIEGMQEVLRPKKNSFPISPPQRQVKSYSYLLTGTLAPPRMGHTQGYLQSYHVVKKKTQGAFVKEVVAQRERHYEFSSGGNPTILPGLSFLNRLLDFALVSEDRSFMFTHERSTSSSQQGYLLYPENSSFDFQAMIYERFSGDIGYKMTTLVEPHRHQYLSAQDIVGRPPYKDYIKELRKKEVVKYVARMGVFCSTLEIEIHLCNRSLFKNAPRLLDLVKALDEESYPLEEYIQEYTRILKEKSNELSQGDIIAVASEDEDDQLTQEQARECLVEMGVSGLMQANFKKEYLQEIKVTCDAYRRYRDDLELIIHVTHEVDAEVVGHSFRTYLRDSEYGGPPILGMRREVYYPLLAYIMNSLVSQ